MKTKSEQTIHSFAVQIILYAIIAIIISCIILGVYSFNQITSDLIHDIENITLATALAVSEMCDGDIIAAYQPGDEQLDSYKDYLATFKSIKNSWGYMMYIYCVKRVKILRNL